MRTNLIRMMDSVGLHTRLEIKSCAELFRNRADLVHYTSALRYPVFKNGDNYNGTPSMVRHPELRKMLVTFLAEEVRTLGRSTLWLPLGPKVSEALEFLCVQGVLSYGQVLSGMPHPSGANAERIKIFLGEKKPEDASNKTNSATILSARDSLMEKLREEDQTRG